ncbi:S8 family peptidase [Agrilutibacter solisilvae]|uniref:S8/S53 family peptidase n=1 Tax=Agrilutibacter solisilvae TaxID=2763317 RepID=A0A975AU37_9GAMM|nr:S8/S53 family peptidase [Lysobacter solisilvae]QSX79735.1 S8/S53 family peptidase [Lysobacter solisilvae]
MKSCSVWVLVLTLCTAPNASAGGPFDFHKIMVRAVKKSIDRDLVKAIAESANAREVSPDEKASGATIRQVIERVCGSVQDGYLPALEKANGMSGLSLDMPLDDPMAPTMFPACLYVYDATSSGKPVEIVVRESDNAAALFERLTGKKPDDKQLVEYFGMPLDKLADLHRGDVLRPKYITQPVKFTISGPDAANLAVQLASDIEAAKGVEAVEASRGRLIVPIEARLASNADLKCTQASAALDGPSIERALLHSKSHAKPTMEVDVMIVDNGFMGADPSGSFANSPFDPSFFRSSPNGNIAKAYDLVETRLPITVRGTSQDPAIYGHGTHVAGIILGGPDFPARDRSKVPLLQDSLRLTVLNVADATNVPFDGAPKALGTEIIETTPWIVNMSLAYDGVGSDPRADGVRTAFPPLFQSHQLSLFVVAAGNDSGDVELRSIYPAILGGESVVNVVTVAALDGNGRIASFSNRGDKVDIAAPGCMIESWTDNTMSLTRLSGTSQAAPLVTFVSSMVRHLLPRAMPFDLKARLVASGDLLAPEDRGATAFGVKVNPVIAMYVFDDYVQRLGQSPLLGDVVRVEGLQCPPKFGGADYQSADTLWSIKRSGAPFFLFSGKQHNDKLKSPCKAIVAANAEVVMRPRHKLTATGIEDWHGPVEVTIPMGDIANVVFASKER